MIHFDTDYMEGCHPSVMQRLIETNLEHMVAPGMLYITQPTEYGTLCMAS